MDCNGGGCYIRGSVLFKVVANKATTEYLMNYKE